MSHSQQQLTAFDESPDTTAPPDQEATTDSDSEQAELDTSGTAFSDPDSFPAARIDTLSTGEITINLCTIDGTVSPTFQTIAGSGGMGADKSIENVDAVADIVTTCIGLPALITGGGMSTPMGSGAVLGRLRDVDRSGESVTVEFQELFRQRGTAREEIRRARLGAYELSLPESTNDCQDAVTALSAWEKGRIDYLNPVERQTQEVIHDRLATFENLSPADKLETPEYASRLEVVSEPFETHTVIPRGTLSNRTIEVLSVVVNNPNGGYYQLGIEQSPTGRSSDIPTCYLSGSYQTPPTPNTAFTRDAKFSSTDLEVTQINHPPNPEIVPPDESILESPLPEPRLRTSIDELDGVGEKTAMKLHRATDERVSAESIAYTMFDDGDIHTSTLDEIKNIFKSLPQKKSVYEQLKTYLPEK
jgi:hypothetical protein